MMVKRQILIFFLVLLSAGLGGEYGDAFIQSAIFPRAQALGHSTVAYSGPSGIALTNPAVYASYQRQTINLAYDQFNGLSNAFVVEAYSPLGDSYHMGLTILHSSVDDLYFRPDLSYLDPVSRRDSVLELAQGSGDIIKYREDAVFLSLAREFSHEVNLGWKFFKIPLRIPIGASVKYLDKLLVDNRGLGIGFDLGGQIIFSLAGMNSALEQTEFSVGYVLHDILNTPVYWETDHQDAIKRGRVRGVSIKQSFPKYSLDAILSTSVQDRFPNVRQWGLEIGYRELAYLRFGSDGYKPSFGLGIGLKKFIIDYSFSQHELAGMQKIGINYHF